MQPTTNTFDSIRTQVPDYSKVITTQNVSKSNKTYPQKDSQKVDKTPTQDTVEIGNKSKLSNAKKALLALGAVATAVVGAIVTHKVISARQVTQLAEHIDFKPAQTIEEAREFARTHLGIKHYELTNLDIANHVNEGLVSLSNSVNIDIVNFCK